MSAPLTHGAATVWLVALVAAIAPATALAQNPVPPPDPNATQQQPMTAPAAPCAPGQPAPAGCPAANPPADPPIGPSGPVVDVPAQPNPPQQQLVTQPLDSLPAAPAGVAPSQPAHDVQPVRQDDPPPAVKPQKPAGDQGSYQGDQPPSRPDKPKPRPKPQGDASHPGYGDHGNGDNGNGNGNNNDGNGNHGNGDDHNQGRFAVDRTAIRLGGCSAFTAATAKVSFERIPFEKDRFKVVVHKLDVPAGTVLTVRIDGRIAGTLTIDANGDGRLVRRGDHLPRFLRLQGDERVTISNDQGQVLLSRACARANDGESGD
jgi:hypothetical protein